MKKVVLSMLLLASSVALYAQKAITRTAKVSFFSGTNVENIEAVSNETAAILDMSNGAFVFQVPIKSFKFEKSLMQDHFNENYMESEKYPKSSFKGKIVNYNAADLGKDGIYKVSVTGELEMHGVTKTITVPGTVTSKGGMVTATAIFKVKPQDYKIEIPSLVATKIAKEIEITVNAVMNKSK